MAYSVLAYRVLFRLTWERLAAAGVTDGRGGAEYCRVADEYEAAGCPAEVVQFIRRRANIGPDGAGPKTSAPSG